METEIQASKQSDRRVDRKVGIKTCRQVEISDRETIRKQESSQSYRQTNRGR